MPQSYALLRYFATVAIYRNGDVRLAEIRHCNFSNLASQIRSPPRAWRLLNSKFNMLRITKTFEDDETIILRLDGRVDSSTVAELQEECDGYKDSPEKTLLLDFSGITFISQSGLKLLQKLKNGRIKLAKGSLFVETLLSDLKD